MKRRDFLRKASGAFALFPLFCLGRTNCSPYHEEIRDPVETSDFKLPHWYINDKGARTDRETCGEHTEGQIREFARIYSNPCKEIRLPRYLPPAPWYDLDDFIEGDFYLNTITRGAWVHSGTHWETACIPYGLDTGSRRGMLCPVCLERVLDDAQEPGRGDIWDAVAKMYSIVLNTSSGGDIEYLIRTDECVCGHPWLETAHEDYVLWMAGESDEERRARRNYPSVSAWQTDRFAKVAINGHRRPSQIYSYPCEGIHPPFKQGYHRRGKV